MGMVIDVSPLHPSKALFLMDVTLSGMMTDLRALHKEKAQSLMDVTVFGMVMKIIFFLSFIPREERSIDLIPSEKIKCPF